jgi:hypothetical protein
VFAQNVSLEFVQPLKYANAFTDMKVQIAILLSAIHHVSMGILLSQMYANATSDGLVPSVMSLNALRVVVSAIVSMVKYVSAIKATILHSFWIVSVMPWIAKLFTQNASNAI